MGDEGKLYNGVTAAAINSMREMISVADLTFPNYTEACYLTSSKYDEKGVSFEEAKRLLDGLRLIGTKSAMITSILVDGTPSVVGYIMQQISILHSLIPRYQYISQVRVTSSRQSSLVIC